MSWLCALSSLFLAAAQASAAPWLVSVSTDSLTVCVPKECRDFAGKPGREIPYEIAGATGAAKLLPAGGPLKFAVIGDTGMNTPEQWAVARRLEKSGAMFVLHTGDVVYPRGAREDYDTKYFPHYRNVVGRLAVYPAVGNHDYANQWIGTGFGKRRFETGYAAVFKKPPYYSFDAGPVHFVSLDVNRAFYIDDASPIGPGTQQDAWLDRDLAASKAPWKIVLLHVPVYSTQKHGKHGRLRQWLEPLFKKHGVRLVFQGHSHVYERTGDVDGTAYVTVGTGGAPLHGKDEPARAPFEFRLREHGHAEVEVDGDELLLRFIDKDGRQRDRRVYKLKPGT